MTFEVTRWARSAFDRAFPEREIYVRSNGSVRYLRVSPIAQIAVVASVLGLGAWATIAAVAGDGGPRLAVSDTTSVEERLAYEARVRALQDRYTRLEAELEDSERRFDAVMQQLSSRHGQVGNQAEIEIALEERLEATRRRLREVTEQRDDVLQRLEDLRLGSLEMERRLADAQRVAEQRRSNLDDFVGTMETAVVERDDARRQVRSLSDEIEALTENIEDIRRHQAQVMTQLEEATRVSLVELESILDTADVDVDALIREIERTYSGEGGPFIPLAYRIPEAARGFPINEDTVDHALNQLQRVNTLRLAVERLPLGRPITAAHRFTSGFGPRRHPLSGRWAMHNGIDFAAPRGTPVLAPVAGVVIYAGRQGGYGNVVKVRHALGYETVYAHLDVIRVSLGASVERGDRLGDVGTTGRSTGNHLHYEIRRYGRPLNPRRFIEAGRDVF